jgi:hypothetical protein
VKNKQANSSSGSDPPGLHMLSAVCLSIPRGLVPPGNPDPTEVQRDSKHARSHPVRPEKIPGNCNRKFPFLFWKGGQRPSVPLGQAFSSSEPSGSTTFTWPWVLVPRHLYRQGWVSGASVCLGPGQASSPLLIAIFLKIQNTFTGNCTENGPC